MLKHLAVNPEAFDPDTIRILVGAMDDAWQTVQASGADFDGDGYPESARAELAKHIVEMAKQGERNQRRLCEGALAYLAKTDLYVRPIRS